MYTTHYETLLTREPESLEGRTTGPNFRFGFRIFAAFVQRLGQAPSVRDLLQAPAMVTGRMNLEFAAREKSWMQVLQLQGAWGNTLWRGFGLFGPRSRAVLSSGARDRALRRDLRRLPRARFLGCPGAAVMILGDARLKIMPLEEQATSLLARSRRILYCDCVCVQVSMEHVQSGQREIRVPVPLLALPGLRLVCRLPLAAAVSETACPRLPFIASAIQHLS